MSVRRSVSSADEHACRSVLYLYISRLPRWISNTPSASSTLSTSQQQKRTEALSRSPRGGIVHSLLVGPIQECMQHGL